MHIMFDFRATTDGVRMNDTEYMAHCHCGSVTIILKKRPDFINDCNCSLCSKSGGIWGYFSWSEVEVFGSTQTYVRRDRSLPVVQVHSCSLCGSTTHWSLTEAYLKKSGQVDRMGLNLSLIHISEPTRPY